MKLIKKLLGITVIFAVIGFMVLPLTGCPEEDKTPPVAPTITTASLPDGEPGTAYSQTLTATGDSPITWRVDGTLPKGLSLTGNTISGTPEICETTTFTVTAKNTVGSSTKQLSIATVFVSIANMGTWLAAQPANTTTTLYAVKLNVSDLGGYSYENASAGKTLKDNSAKYVNLDLSGSTITSIGQQAFQGCSTLTGITMPNTLTNIEGNAFQTCISLTSVTIPASVTSIENQAFTVCPNLTSVTFQGANTNIGNGSFNNSGSLQTAYAANGIGRYKLGGETWAIVAEASTINPSNITSIVDLDTWLDAQPANTAATAYTVKLNVSNLGGIAGVNIRQTLTNNSTKYVSLDLSGITMTSIGDTAFAGCTSLTNITIPASVTSIGQMAFLGCTSLTAITIPASVTSIGQQVFQNCTSLTAITVDSGNTNYISDQGVLYNKDKTVLVAYPAGKTGTLTIPDSVTSIGGGAFAGCAAFTNITIPASVNSIGQMAFSGCTSLTSITLSASVTSIGQQAFQNCTSLTAITVDPGNTNYISDQGVLYNKDKTILVAYPAGKTGTFTISDSVTSIGDGAFAGCAAFTNITIPDGVTSVGQQVFQNCTSLTSITLPASVTSIGDLAFFGCTSLTSVTFATGSNIPDANFGSRVSPEGSTGAGGNTLKTAYNAASPKEGTYTRAANGSTWTKQP